MSYVYSWDRLLCGDYKHRLVELQRAHSITGRAQAIDCVKPERLLRKVQTSSGGRHAPRSSCASATRGLAQHRFQLYSSRLLCRLAGGERTRGMDSSSTIIDPSHQHQKLSDDGKTPRRATFTLGRN